MNVSREQKLKDLNFEDHKKKISDELLDLFYEKYLALKLKTINDDEIKVDQVNYKVKHVIILKFVNKILESANENIIDHLTEFIKINKTVIVNEKTKKIVEDMDAEICEYFIKNEIGYSRTNTENYVLNLLRGMLSTIDHKLERFSTKIKKDGKKMGVIYYTIVKK